MNIIGIDLQNDIYERFINLLNIDNNGCWLYRTPAKSGYANFGITKSESYRAHRFSYEMHKGKIDPNLQIDHLCSVKNCCNPDHLEAVTAKENVRRAWERGDAKPLPREIALRNGRIGNAAAAQEKRDRTHCKRGHPFNEENTVKRKDGGRDCKQCQKIRSKEFYEKRKCQTLL